MVAGKFPDWLPAGWTEQVKVKNGRKLKYYYKEETGQKFYSQKEVTRYVELGNPCHGTPQQKSKDDNTSSESKPMPPEMEANETPEWLPHGWIMEMKTRNSGSESGRKYKCYIDPRTGRKFYSKPQVSEYLKTVRPDSCASQEVKKDIGSASNPKLGELTGGKMSLKPEGSQHMETLEWRSCTSKQNQIGFGEKPVKEVVLERVTPGSSQNHETLEGPSCTPKRKQIDFRKYSVNKVGIQRVTPDGLPSGWIKEIRIQKNANGIRKDPYYTDPVSGYVFRSQKDALRYLESGDINRCALKPKKRDELEFLNGETSLPSAPNMHQSGQHTTSRQLLEGLEKCVKSSLETPDDEGLRKQQKQQCTSAFTDPMITSTPTWKHILDNGIEDCAETKVSNDHSSSQLPRTEGSEIKLGERVCAENGASSSPSTETVQEEKLPDNLMGTLQIKSKKKIALSLPRRSSNRLVGIEPPEVAVDLMLGERVLRYTARKSGENEGKPSLGALENLVFNAPSLQPFEKLSERECGYEASRTNDEQSNKITEPLENNTAPGENGTISAPTEILQKHNSTENGMGNNSRTRMQNGSSKSKKEKAASLPRRSSKRLGGLEPEMEVNLVLSEQLLRAEARKSGETEAKPSLGTLNTVLVREIAHHEFTGTEAPSNVERSEKALEDQPVPEDEPVRQETEKKEEMNLETPLLYPFDDSWSDPCLEFAFKTLTGAIPIEDNIAIQGYFQQQVDTSNPLTEDSCLSLPEIGFPNFFQSDISSDFAATGKPLPVPQLPENDTFPAPGNVGDAPQ